MSDPSRCPRLVLGDIGRCISCLVLRPPCVPLSVDNPNPSIKAITAFNTPTSYDHVTRHQRRTKARGMGHHVDKQIFSRRFDWIYNEKTPAPWSFSTSTTFDRNRYSTFPSTKALSVSRVDYDHGKSDEICCALETWETVQSYQDALEDGFEKVLKVPMIRGVGGGDTATLASSMNASLLLYWVHVLLKISGFCRYACTRAHTTTVRSRFSRALSAYPQPSPTIFKR